MYKRLATCQVLCFRILLLQQTPGNPDSGCIGQTFTVAEGQTLVIIFAFGGEGHAGLCTMDVSSRIVSTCSLLNYTKATV